MQANMAWKATKAMAGSVASGLSVIRLSSPAYWVKFPRKPELAIGVAEGIE